ncbi:hypothetical protein [Nitrosopumilus sp.]|uniref:hypothetical protein n=1 Tax=Nitrosopumilus sp. TaxID=2024843 RepID=UPI00292F12EF|nr:hypothetical protein [Nitrosopumilus sp.]
MVKDLLVRGFDDEIHSKLGNVAGKMGVSLNSIVKDAVDKWLETNSQITKKHELIMYTDNEALKNLLKSMSRIAQNDDIFNACCGPKDHIGMQFLTKQGWFNGTVEPYQKFLENPNAFGRKILEKIGEKVSKKQLMVLAFLTGDLAEKQSVPKSVHFCQWYDKQNVEGITHCVAHAKDILSANFEDTLHLFDTHDQVFIAKKDSLYKMHVTRENIHKLFLN